MEQASSNSRTPSISSEEEAFDLFESDGEEDRGEGWATVQVQGKDVKVPAQRVHIWESSKMMAEWVSGQVVKGKVCLELGCGIGLPSIAAALCGAKKVYATDLSPTAIKELGAVIRINNDHPELQNIVPSVMDWNSPGTPSPPIAGSIDVILAADVNYETACTAPLTWTITYYHTPHVTRLYLASRVGRVSLQDSIDSLSETLHPDGTECLHHDEEATHLLYCYS
eukprot:TRINITY_DN27179_c0_g1_i1.p1 TRINITY_DN27179_c0_g1~~TRINITY_DN27179_c0_g1_i1.p1  ORF type:complete len:225 (+),score=63.80 TRINITY_DN27179_c0_g1_i1:46-720(+)